jgi:hypothetical protein
LLSSGFGIVRAIITDVRKEEEKTNGVPHDFWTLEQNPNSFQLFDWLIDLKSIQMKNTSLSVTTGEGPNFYNRDYEILKDFG